MQLILEPSWASALASELQMDYWSELMAYVAKQYRNESCYPDPEAIFKAFELTPLGQVKVVILGQDPYHGPGQAHGLCFSVPEGVSQPPSLQNLFKELQEDLNCSAPSSGNLENWATQGVFLLNATLTVRAHQAGSHQKHGWEVFTDQVIRTLSKEKTGLVFLLWGGYAKQKARLIDENKHCILKSGHPSPLSANRGYWFGNKHFSKCNAYLKKQGQNPIQWT